MTTIAMLAGRFKHQHQGLTWLGLAALISYQAWLYYFRLPLSLGPRVIFEPWALRGGFLLYENITDIHPPLVPWVLAVLGYLVPEPLRLAKLVLVGLISLSTLLAFWIGQRQFGIKGGLASASLFVLWAPTFGFGKLWYEAFLTPAYLAYLLAFHPTVSPRMSKNWFWVGLLGGITVLIKQHAALVFAGFLAWQAMSGFYLKRPWKVVLRELFLTGLVSFIPVGLALVVQWGSVGTLKSMLYWIIAYPFSDVYRVLANQTVTFQQIEKLVGIYLLAPAVVLSLLEMFRRRDPSWLKLGGWLVIAITAAFTAYPRFDLFHLQGTLPLTALITAWLLVDALRTSRALVVYPFVVGVILSLSGFWGTTNIRPHLDAILAEQPRRISEYSDLETLAIQIRQVAGQPESFYIFTDDEATSNLYYLLDCPPPRFWIFHYPWYMLKDVKAQIFATLEQNPPEWVLFVPDRWAMEIYFPEFFPYLQANYQEQATFTFGAGQALLLRRIPGR